MKRNDYVRVGEIPSLLPISEVTARRLIAAKKLPSIRVGRQIFVLRRELEKWLAQGGNNNQKSEDRSGCENE